MTNITPEFAADYAAAWAELPDLHADQTADTGKFTYQYVSVNQVLGVLRPVFAKHHMAIIQIPYTTDFGPRIKTVVLHAPSGERMVVGDLALPAGSTAQQAGSAITYARRYSLTAAFGLAVDDDDGAAASKPVRETFKEDAETWLKTRIGIFEKWDRERKVDAWAVAAAELNPGKPMTKAEAEKIFAHMAAAYYQEHPEDEGAPF